MKKTQYLSPDSRALEFEEESEILSHSTDLRTSYDDDDDDDPADEPAFVRWHSTLWDEVWE